jgi:hypothetical protein
VQAFAAGEVPWTVVVAVVSAVSAIVPILGAVPAVVLVVLVVMTVVGVRVAAQASAIVVVAAPVVVVVLVRGSVGSCRLRVQGSHRHEGQRERRLRPVGDEQETAERSAERAANPHAVLRKTAGSDERNGPAVRA